MSTIMNTRSFAAACGTMLMALFVAACGEKAAPADPEVARWEATAARVTITRDTWGIPHVKGPTDPDVVFGAMYAQAEDDFNRIEVNYLNALGRLAEAEGESAIWSDLRMKLFINPDSMQAKYATSPDSLKRLMDAFADGLNYYLHANPQVKPQGAHALRAVDGAQRSARGALVATSSR
jgi:acyl-homoserine-lactone acylase